MIIKEKVIKYGHNVDTDVIIPARYLNTTDEKELASHCFEDLDQAFAEKLKKAKIVVAGTNFGCGSSREHAPLAIKASGVRLVVASSFARIFFRNAINIGLPLVQSSEASQETEEGDVLEVDLSGGSIKNVTRDKVYSISPLPDFIQGVIQSGGYIPYIKGQMKK